MSDPIALISCVHIDDAELASFIREIGGVVEAEYHHLGRYSHGKCHVWVFNNPAELEYALEAVGSTIVEKLGCTPKTNIVLEVSKEEGSKNLAVDFVVSFLTRWPQSVVYDCDEMIFSPGEVLKMKQTSQNFWSYSG